MRQTIPIFCLVLFSCNPLRHYQSVAVDTKYTTQGKVILAPWVFLNFPPVITPGRTDTITYVQNLPGDTLTTVELIHDTVTVRQTVRLPGRIITNTITKIDTVESRAGMDALRTQLQTVGGQILRDGQTIEDLQERLKKSRNWLWWAIGLGAALAASIVLHFKR